MWPAEPDVLALIRGYKKSDCYKAAEKNAHLKDS